MLTWNSFNTLIWCFYSASGGKVASCRIFQENFNIYSKSSQFFHDIDGSQLIGSAIQLIVFHMTEKLVLYTNM